MTPAYESAVSQRNSLARSEYLPEDGLETRTDNTPEDDLPLLCKQVMHDVRGNLVTLTIMAKLLQRGSYGALPENVSKQMAALEKKANAAANLLENFCRLTAVTGKGPLHFEKKLDCLLDVMIPVEQELSMELANKEVSLIFISAANKRFLIDGNKLLLQSVFRTIFHNAVRHSNRKSRITCDLDDNEGMIRIAITNEGAVVPDHLRDRIFSEFTKAESAKSDSTAGDGLGLGLYLGRNIINRHGGEIWYEPLPAGSKFILTLPAAK